MPYDTVRAKKLTVLVLRRSPMSHRLTAAFSLAYIGVVEGTAYSGTRVTPHLVYGEDVKELKEPIDAVKSTIEGVFREDRGIKRNKTQEKLRICFLADSLETKRKKRIIIFLTFCFFQFVLLFCCLAKNYFTVASIIFCNN